jgi:hypothetical protein
VTFLRLTRWHAVAALAALVLLAVMALDWYTTEQGEEARRIEAVTGEPSGEPTQRQFDVEVIEGSSITAEENEENAWQATGLLNRLVLILLLASAVLTLAAAALRAAGRTTTGAGQPSVAAAGIAALATVLVAIRIIDAGALEVGGEVEIGAPLGLLTVGVLAIAAARAARVEREEQGAEAVPR